ncbi:QacE family quaternary ammonium compound efflux SMR transporter [Bacillus salacetis]|uniref:QacE family quaternary ammonium compound efflux SMR transporter n=1 Tax=Bacillus salacetis TaxID=2315464 RepID=A0A3A1R9J8_9BACI|nr:multidrug efflux SMR transporter [Bacillus salacetis]RIW38444.1 QacE family quaternary ammonium compound efflux SMR transporter [Bacillus salacetis]
MAWLYLIIGGILEIGWAIGLSFSNGFTSIAPSIVTILLLTISFYFFAKSMKLIPIGTAYAAFTGIGAGGTSIAGMLFLGEEVSVPKILFICLLIFGVIGLKFSSKEEEANNAMEGK